MIMNFIQKSERGIHSAQIWPVGKLLGIDKPLNLEWQFRTHYAFHTFAENWCERN